MPLAQLVQGGAAAAASGARPPKPPRQRAPQQQDVCTLLVHVLLRVQQGQPLCLDTVKATWRELTFSHVFEVRSGSKHYPLLPGCVALRAHANALWG